jgi:integrase
MTAPMKVSDFMLNLAKNLQEERKIAESTATQYLQTLHKLNGGKPFNNLAWTKKYDDVQKIIDTYAVSTQGNQYMVLSSALSLFNGKATYKGAYNYWRDKMMEARKERDAQPLHEKSEKQEENWLTWEEVDKKKSGLSEDISSFLSSKHLTATQFDKLLHFVVLSLYTDIQPRRNQDYLDMYVVKKLGKDYDKTKNYYDVATQRFIFNKYKTAKKHGEQVEEVPEPLQATLKTYLSHHPLAKSKAKEFKLLVKPDGSPLNTVNSITRILNRIFGKKIGSSMLRHSYLSSKYGNVMKEMEDDAEAMGHTTGVQRGYIKN